MAASKAIYIEELQVEYMLPEEVELSTHHSSAYIEALKRINRLPFSGLEIYYADDVWDFSDITTLNINKSCLRFRFAIVRNSVFKDDVKNYVLLSILENKLKIQTLNRRYYTIMDFLLFVEKQHVYHCEDISIPIVKNYIEKIRKNSSLTVFRDKKTFLKHFFMQYSANFKDILSAGMLKLFEHDNPRAYKAYQFEHRTQDIPKDYFNKFMSAIIQVMNDETRSIYDRGAACVFVILSQTGLRIGEILGLEVGNLFTKTIFNGERTHYLTYRTWKREAGNNVSTTSFTYINELTFEAYNVLNEIYKERREKFGFNYLYMGGKRPTKKTFPYSSESFNAVAMRFLIKLDEWGLLRTVNLNTSNYPTVHVYNTTSKKLRRLDGSGEVVNTITAPTSQQFRFHCCSVLEEKGVPLEYIKRFMSHLTNDMIRYHILPQTSPQEDMEFSLRTLREVVSGKTKILGENKGLTDNINEFIEKNHFNVATDLDEICESLSKRIPIRQKTGGVCIKSSQLRECSMDAKTNEFYCAYGVCPNIVHFYYMVDITYRQCKELQETIALNEKRGHKKQVQKEKNMLQSITNRRLLPELEELKVVIERDGVAKTYEMHPEVQPIVENMDVVEKEAVEWSTKSR